MRTRRAVRSPGCALVRPCVRAAGLRSVACGRALCPPAPPGHTRVPCQRTFGRTRGSSPGRRRGCPSPSGEQTIRRARRTARGCVASSRASPPRGAAGRVPASAPHGSRMQRRMQRCTRRGSKVRRRERRHDRARARLHELPAQPDKISVPPTDKEVARGEARIISDSVDLELRARTKKNGQMPREHHM